MTVAIDAQFLQIARDRYTPPSKLTTDQRVPCDPPPIPTTTQGLSLLLLRSASTDAACLPDLLKSPATRGLLFGSRFTQQ